MNARPRNVNGLREELLAKEKELSSVQDFLLEQDDDLRSCLHRVGDLELELLANRPDSCETKTGCGETPPPQTKTPLRHELTSGDARAATAVAAQGNTPSARHSSSSSSNSGCIAPRQTPISGMYLPSSSPGAGQPPASPPRSPDDDSARRRIFAESPACCAVGNGRADAPVTPLDRNQTHERERQDRRRHHRGGDGEGDPAGFRHRVANAAVGIAKPTASAAPEPRRGVPAAPTAPPSKPAAAAAAAAPSPSSDERRARVSSGRTSTCRPERSCNGAAGLGGAIPSAAGATTVGGRASPRFRSDRLKDLPFQEQGQREPEGDASCLAMEGLAERDERVAHAERRAGAAEAAERSAAASAVAAMKGARAAKDEAERLRLEGLELSRWREAVLDLRDALRVAERDGGGEGRGDGGDRSDDDPVVRHARWVSFPALGTLLPHLQQGAQDLLSDLVAARARIPAPSTTVTAAPPVATRPSGGGTRIATGDRECTRIPTSAGRWSRDEARSGDARSGEANCSTHSFELQSRRGQQQCAVCSGVSNNGGCSRGVCCGGSGEAGAEAASAAAAATAGLGVGHGVVDKSAACLEKECETLRIVVQALREKEEDSQRRIATLEEGMLQASLAAVERDALVSVLRRQLARRDSCASDAAAEGSDGHGRDRSRSCSRGRVGFRGPGSIDAVSTPEQGVVQGGRRSRVFGDDVAVEPSPQPSTRLPRSGCWNAASVVEDDPDPTRCRRLSSSMLPSDSQPDRCRGRQACAHSSLDSGCCRHQAEACCCCSRSAHILADPSRRDDSRYPCDGNHERERTAAEKVSPSGQAPSTPNNALAAFTGTPPMVALRGGYRDRRGGGGGGGGSGGTGCSAERGSGERTPRTVKKEKRPGHPQVPTPTTDVIRRLLYESTPTSQVEPGGGSTGRIAANGRRLFSEVSTTGDSGNADGVRGGAPTGTALFSDYSPCRRSGGSGVDPSERRVSRGVGARGERSRDGRAMAALGADEKHSYSVGGCSVGTATTAMAEGRIAKGELVLRERLLQARRDFSALRMGAPADELVP